MHWAQLVFCVLVTLAVTHQHPIHESERAPKTFTNHADYRKGTTVINHFYEKLFLLPEKMHTHFGKQEALRRKDFMTTF